MAITLEQIKSLRDRTGVSITACKAALDEAGGDEEKAIDFLRKKGEAKAADKADRSTAHSFVAVVSEGGKAAIVELRCETDFVAKDQSFMDLGNELAKKVLHGEITSPDAEIPELSAAMMRLGEKIQIENMAVVEGEVLGSYTHSNKIGVLVALNGGNEELAKDVAMHAAATNPRVMSPDEVPTELVEKEYEIWREQLANEGKPAEIMEKILMGKEKKFREENALLKQAFVKNPDMTIEQLLQAQGATLVKFVRFG